MGDWDKPYFGYGSWQGAALRMRTRIAALERENAELRVLAARYASACSQHDCANASCGDGAEWDEMLEKELRAALKGG